MTTRLVRSRLSRVRRAATDVAPVAVALALLTIVPGASAATFQLSANQAHYVEAPGESPVLKIDSSAGEAAQLLANDGAEDALSVACPGSTPPLCQGVTLVLDLSDADHSVLVDLGFKYNVPATNRIPVMLTSGAGRDVISIPVEAQAPLSVSDPRLRVTASSGGGDDVVALTGRIGSGSVSALDPLSTVDCGPGEDVLIVPYPIATSSGCERVIVSADHPQARLLFPGDSFVFTTPPSLSLALQGPGGTPAANSFACKAPQTAWQACSSPWQPTLPQGFPNVAVIAQFTSTGLSTPSLPEQRWLYLDTIAPSPPQLLNGTTTLSLEEGHLPEPQDPANPRGIDDAFVDQTKDGETVFYCGDENGADAPACRPETMPPGTYTLYFYAKDMAGNSSPKTLITLNITPKRVVLPPLTDPGPGGGPSLAQGSGAAPPRLLSPPRILLVRGGRVTLGCQATAIVKTCGGRLRPTGARGEVVKALANRAQLTFRLSARMKAKLKKSGRAGLRATVELTATLSSGERVSGRFTLRLRDQGRRRTATSA